MLIAWNLLLQVAHIAAVGLEAVPVIDLGPVLVPRPGPGPVPQATVADHDRSVQSEATGIIHVAIYSMQLGYTMGSTEIWKIGPASSTEF